MNANTDIMTEPTAATRVRVSDLVALTKPRIVMLALFATLLGYCLGASGGIDLLTLAFASVGIVLVGAGGNALNMVMERGADAKMVRTSKRPLPSGKVSVKDAVLFGIALTGIGWFLLLVGVNHITALLAAFTFASYLFLYTPMKELTSFCTVVGAIPGALPPVLGWTSATGQLGWGAVVLFGILFFWQLPHFFPIAWMHREDYERGGFRMLSLGDKRGLRTSWASALTCLPLIAVSLAPQSLGMTGPVYTAAATVLGMGFLFFALAFVAARTYKRARMMFLYSLIYLPVLLVVLVMDALTDWV